MDELLLILNTEHSVFDDGIEPTRRHVEPSVAADYCRAATGESIEVKYGNSESLTRRKTKLSHENILLAARL